jgi:hypothetical protein
MPDNATVIAQTKKWLSTIVIGHGLCPFAKSEFDNDNIHYAVIEEASLDVQMAALLAECAALDNYAERETSLLIFPKTFADFEDYLDMLSLATALLKEQGYEGVYQLASFHPEYRFKGAGCNDPANYTNRSPYPMLHILREASVERALESYLNPEKIPVRNIQFMQALGLISVKERLSKCYQQS